MTEHVSPYNQRPVEVTTIAEATFADILDIGIGTLATRDATVIERIAEPSYLELQGDTALAVRAKHIRKPSEVAHFVKSHPAFGDLLDMHGELILQQRGGNGRHSSTAQVSSGNGFPLDAPPSSFQAAHTDENTSHEQRVTMSFTLFHASVAPWLWRLTPDAFIHDTRRHRAQPSVDVPLSPPGCVIMGENARVAENGKPRSVGHQVVSPRSAWEGRNVKRVRLLVTN